MTWQRRGSNTVRLKSSDHYIFLYKLTGGEKDLCIGSMNENRYRQELHNIIGMFVNTLPYRLTLDPTLSFKNLLMQVQQLCLDILEYSYFPYQQIIQLHRTKHQQSLLPFIQIIFQFETSSQLSNDIGLDENILCQLVDDNKVLSLFV
ncbi:unnamed protein product [Didymodactylos carnosus]|uniref:Condensation domain-containing protein n=1 Tax=Didymodactylos carnosus TaxID=1234261 RepID=A0A8S2JWQ1_9BILA|nr:unnamed protein product [Didymodactylos carnosus]CAF3817434.1 unnamed protein product [Didymodactylos carnosus]